MELLKQVGYAVTEFPSDFTPHKQIKKVYEARRNMIDTGEGVDWGMAETLAYATLLSEGNHVRLSGQDVERGTFSHRMPQAKQWVCSCSCKASVAVLRVRASVCSKTNVLMGGRPACLDKL
eukprot:1158984-Pelagomonas_calceolata.AAC.2